MSDLSYTPTNAPQSSFYEIRGLRYHALSWGRFGRPLVVMLHGWMDVAHSFQFLVDAWCEVNPNILEQYHFIAPDWRGFGLTDGGSFHTRSSRNDAYWFPDYLADLDALMRQVCQDRPVTLVGHSMGGNVATLWAGVRPERVERLINIEGYGLKAGSVNEAPGRYARWLDELAQSQDWRDYESIEAVAARLQRNNPRLRRDRALWLAQHWAEPQEQRWSLMGDPAHRRINPVLYRVEEVLACWRQVTAPVLWIDGLASEHFAWISKRGELERRRQHLARVQVETIADAGHMVHHDQPEALALILNRFLD